jgi:glycosyltransferase involved in cell wall biosynthesis
MKNKTTFNSLSYDCNQQTPLLDLENNFSLHTTLTTQKHNAPKASIVNKPEILFVTSYPPRECGIATYSQDLIKALNNKFSDSLSIKVCALETDNTKRVYPDEVKLTLDTSNEKDYRIIAKAINKNNDIRIVLIQHEFGFYRNHEGAFLQLINTLTKPVVIVFHTVLPHPNNRLRLNVQDIAAACNSIIVMTHTSATILMQDYGVPQQKISVIAHGTHLVPHLSEKFLKEKQGLTDRKVLTTFGLLSSGKSIETTLEALPSIVKKCPEVVFLIIGKTHPEVVKTEGETYRQSLELKVKEYGLQKHVIFINEYLALPELLEYLQLTDIYLFTTNDPNQAVSGTFAYAMSCACPIISTPIPHAKEVLTKDTGIIFDFRNSQQLSAAVIRLLDDDDLRESISSNTLQKIVSTAWENSAVAHAMLFQKISKENIVLRYNVPAINMKHLQCMTTNRGIIQFSKRNQPDISSGYTLDDNARALVATCMYFQLTDRERSIHNIRKYLRFITQCQQPDGSFLNYVDENLNFTHQNSEVNLDDANGRAIWALGYVRSLIDLLPWEILAEAETTLEKAILRFENVHSPRAIAFSIKGLYYFLQTEKLSDKIILLKTMADRLVELYTHESDGKWNWYEGYLTYANSILPEAMLCAWLITKNPVYKEIALSSFDFLLAQIFNENGIEVISNKLWLQRGEQPGHFGEQPIDVAYTILALDKFYEAFHKNEHRIKIETAFEWFLGNNRLHQIIYNPCTGGCYDGLEELYVNLNQGAESTVSYLMARITMEKYANLEVIQPVSTKEYPSIAMPNVSIILSAHTNHESSFFTDTQTVKIIETNN